MLIGGEFPVSFSIVVGLNPGVETYWPPDSLATFLVRGQGGCSFSLFGYDSCVSFCAIGLIWGI